MCVCMCAFRVSINWKCITSATYIVCAIVISYMYIKLKFFSNRDEYNFSLYTYQIGLPKQLNSTGEK